MREQHVLVLVLIRSRILLSWTVESLPAAPFEVKFWAFQCVMFYWSNVHCGGHCGGTPCGSKYSNLLCLLINPLSKTARPFFICAIQITTLPCAKFACHKKKEGNVVCDHWTLAIGQLACVRFTRMPKAVLLLVESMQGKLFVLLLEFGSSCCTAMIIKSR